MYITNKSRCTKLSSVLLSLFFLIVFTLPADAVDLPFDPNDFTFLIYDPEGRESSIVSAMEKILGVDTFDPNNIRTSAPGEGVTMEDLSTHDILIVGWNDNYGDVGGLDEDILAAGITGRVILSGHDLDFHTAPPPGYEYYYRKAAETMLVQAIDWVLNGGGTGMITLGCTDGFPYIPEEWDVTPQYLYYGGEDVNEFTEEGLASGVYDGLEPDDFDNWYTSYHDIFTIEQGSDFVEFELGGDDGDDIITIARLWSVYGIELTKTDVNDSNCVSPGDYITYTIYYANSGPNAFNDVNIVDYLPQEVIPDDPFDPNYDPAAHTYTWNIGTLSPNDANSVTLTVMVNELADPLGTITNTCVLDANVIRLVAREVTDVNCWDIGIIYVDVNAAGSNNNGMSWKNAYTDLQSALERARRCCQQARLSRPQKKLPHPSFRSNISLPSLTLSS